MNLERTEDSASRFAAYVGQVTGVIGHADRVRPLNDYCAGLLSQRAAGAWKSIAAVTAPAETSVQQGVGIQSAETCVAHDRLARGNER